MTVLTGGCHCGAIRYAAEGSVFDETVCHCSVCRRTSGAPLIAWFTVAPAGFRFTQGTPIDYWSTAHGMRRFCPACGTQLTFQSTDHPNELDVTTASLDDPEQVPPLDHTWAPDAVSWIWRLDALPRFRRQRDDPED